MSVASESSSISSDEGDEHLCRDKKGVCRCELQAYLTFKKHLKKRGLLPKSIERYLQKVKQFVGFVNKKKLDKIPFEE